MLTYQIRQRVFRLAEHVPLPFPNIGRLHLHFSPEQPFGAAAGGGKTAVKGVAARMLFNANTGTHSVESATPLRPLNVNIQDGSRTVSMNGCTCTIEQWFTSNADLTSMVESLYFGMPTLLAIEFADPPVIVRVDGDIGGRSFRWELANWQANLEITTQERQEQAVEASWRRLGVLASGSRRRLMAAIHYFHVALRLSRQGQTAGEFLAEVLLNLSKVLEVLFPATGDGKTREGVRQGLKLLGFTDVEVEGDFLPAMALRNEIDVAHVDLSLFNRDQLATIHDYVENVERPFRTLLKRVFDGIEAGSYDVPGYVPRKASGASVKIIERLKTRSRVR